MDNLLNLENVRVTYDKSQALKGVSLYVPKEAIATLIGANGAGKTTTLKAISGIVNLLSGEIWYDGHRIDKVPPQQRVKIGIAHAPEGRRLFPYMTVVDNLYIGAYLRKETERIKSDLEMVLSHFPRLSERLRQKAGSLSGGEQQMLAMGRALMAAPRLLLLDEPTMGLSPLLVREVAKIIRNIKDKEGVTILLVEQNARMALSLAEIAYVLETGTITIVGEPKNLINNDHIKRAYLGG